MCTPVGAQWFSASLNLIQSKAWAAMETEQQVDVCWSEQRVEMCILQGIRGWGVSVLVWSGDWQLEVKLAALKKWRNREEEMRNQQARGELDQ